MATWTLQRRDQVNQGTVSCPSGNVYPVDLRACVTVNNEHDRDALLEVGRPPQFMRDLGHDRHGFWELVAVDGVRVPSPAGADGRAAARATGPLTPADPEALKIFGDSSRRPDEELTIEADEGETGAPPPTMPQARPARPQGGADWRTAKAKAAQKPDPAERANRLNTKGPAGRVCPAITTKNRPCQGIPMAGRKYCPMHLKLERQEGG
jgi:hypothetical protein